MVVSLWKPPNDLETHPFPELDRRDIATDHEIELHVKEAAHAGMLQRVPAHSRGDAASAGAGGRDVSAIRDVCSSSQMIGLKEVAADDALTQLGHEHLVCRREPVRD